MIFSSFQFIGFFLIFILCVKVFKNNQRGTIILFSLLFYGFWNPIFIFLIFFFLLSSYFFIKKNFDLRISIPVILLPLFYYKYSFFLSSLFEFKTLNLISYSGNLPLAISFITFTIIAILIDTKTKKYNERIDFFTFSEFLVYFPQLIAGPILRAKELIPLLQKEIVFSNDNIKFGIFLFTVGFVKKIFLADSIAIYIDPIFENPNLVNQGDYIKAFLLFPLQIYFDFSGYVDMALGVSKILSINLPINFNKPYLSTSLTEFWRNWHITLSKWFKDYIYIPLGGSKTTTGKLFFNLIITMSIAGLWHGANINFILWGLLNGLFLFIEKKISHYFNLNKIIKIFFTTFIVFNLWIIFRITDLNKIHEFYLELYFNFFRVTDLENMILLFVTIICIYSQKFDNYKSIEKLSNKTKFLFLIPIVTIIIITGLAINTGSSEKFIYFDF